ncbi:MAG TPA: M56 family metallopeptidase [Mucilaginibacter sp.]
MPALFLFLFKVNMALVLFCLGYYLVLRHLTFYTLNRIYLVTAIIFSTLYPKINLSDFVQQHQQLTEPVQTVMLRWETPAKNLVKPLYQPNYWQWVEVIFWAGVILFAARMVIQLISLLRLYRRSQPGQIDEHKVRLLKDDIGPFSFWRSVYVNPTKLSPAELKNVLQHEQIHVSQWHTLDLLLAELSTIFYWFNPGVWLMKRAVRENLEFITDRKILQKGADSKEYQYSLVSVSLAAMPNSIVNHFNISTIKKRIIMMNAKRSPGYNLTRYVFLVPAVVVLLLTFSLSKAEVAKHTFKTIASAISHVAIVNSNENSVKRSAATTITRTKPVVTKTSAKKATTYADTIYSARAKNGRKSFMVTADTSPDSINYVLNGQKSSKDEVKAIDPERIKSIELMNAESAKEFYPELDNDRKVMFVTTEDSEAGKKLKEKMDKTMRHGAIANNISINDDSDIAPTSARGTTMAYSINSSSSDDVSVNGEGSKNVNAVTIVGVNPKVTTKVSANGKSYVYVKAMPKTNVVVSDDVAPEVVTVQGYKRLVTPDGKPEKIYVSKFTPDNDQLTINSGGKPLFIIDGKEVKSINNLNPNDIKSITVLKNGTAEKKYGDKGKNGVIEIHTKKGK